MCKLLAFNGILILLAIAVTNTSHGQVTDTLQAGINYQKGKGYYERSDFDSAAFWFAKSAALWERMAMQSNDSLCWVRAYQCENKISNTHFVLNNLQQCKYGLSRTIGKVHKLWDRHPMLEAQYHETYGLIFVKKREFDSAIYHLELARELNTEVFTENSLEVANIYGSLGGIFALTGKHSQGFRYAKMEVDIKTQLLPKDHLALATAHNHMGFMYTTLGAFDQALDNYLEAVRLRKLNGTDKGYRYALVLGNIGFILRRKNDLNLSKDYHYQEFAIKKATLPPNHPSLAKSYYKLGDVHYDLGEYTTSLDYYNTTLRIYNELYPPDHPDVAATRNQKGLALLKLGRPQMAIEVLNENLNSEFGASPSIPLAQAYYNLSEIYVDIKEYSKALEYSQHALATLQSIFDAKHSEVANAYYKLAKVYKLIGSSQEALVSLQNALINNIPDFDDRSITANPTNNHVPNDPIIMLETVTEKAKILMQNSDQIDIAEATWQLAIDVIDNIRTGYRNEEAKLNLMNQAREVYENQISIIYNKFSQSGNPRYVEKALSVIEKTKATILFESIKEVKAKHITDIPEIVLDLEEELRVKLSFNEKQIFDLENQKDQDSERLREVKGEFFNNKQSYDSLIKMIERSYPDYYKLKYDKSTTDIATIQELLEKDELLIEYLMTDEYIYVIRITSRDAEFKRIESPKEFKGDLLAFINELKDTKKINNWNEQMEASYRSRASQIYNTLLGQIINEGASYKKLIIVPDGVLNYLPFECLIDDDGSQVGEANHYLLKQFNMRYAYSTTLMVNYLQNERLVTPGFIGFAPDYDPTNLLASIDNANMVDSTVREGMAPLKFNMDEVKYISDLFNGSAVTGQNVSEGMFKEQAPQAGILHLAMHALINDEDPKYSGFVFAGSDSTDNVRNYDDNILHAYELYNMKISAKLAVLSACKTGFGKINNGEGPMSLSRAFQYAGCPNLVMSLWQADDEATFDLMKEFYLGINEGLPKDEALRMAKLRYLETHDKIHPYYWANFVLIGDDQPLKRSNWSFRYVLIASALFFVALIIIFRKKHKQNLQSR